MEYLTQVWENTVVSWAKLQNAIAADGPGSAKFTYHVNETTGLPYAHMEYSEYDGRLDSWDFQQVWCRSRAVLCPVYPNLGARAARVLQSTNGGGRTDRGAMALSASGRACTDSTRRTWARACAPGTRLLRHCLAAGW